MDADASGQLGHPFAALVMSYRNRGGPTCFLPRGELVGDVLGYPLAEPRRAGIRATRRRASLWLVGIGGCAAHGVLVAKVACIEFSARQRLRLS